MTTRPRSHRGLEAVLAVALCGSALTTNCTARFRDSVVDGLTGFILSPQIPAELAACLDGSEETSSSIFCPP